MKRLFVGVRPTADCVETLSRFQGELKTCGWESLQPRWLAPESFHLTLHFLGEVPPTREQALRRGLFREWPALAESGIIIQPLDHWQPLPSADKAKVVALAGAPVPELAKWHASLRKWLESLGFKTEKGPLLPHVSVVRFPKASRPNLPNANPALEFKVAGIVLYESAGGSGPNYLPVQEFRLARP